MRTPIDRARARGHFLLADLMEDLEGLLAMNRVVFNLYAEYRRRIDLWFPPEKEDKLREVELDKKGVRL